MFKKISLVLSLLGLLMLPAPQPIGAVNCKDCIYDACTAVGGDFGWKTCTENTRLRCLLTVLIDGDPVCLAWMEVGSGCNVSNGCLGAI